jgi:4'-phosphopantetheinyl transferase EntD
MSYNNVESSGCADKYAAQATLTESGVNLGATPPLTGLYNQELLRERESVQRDAIESMTASAAETLKLVIHSRGKVAYAIASVEEQSFPKTGEAELMGLGVCEKRLRRRVAGREVPKAALERLGLTNPPWIGRGERGEPLWPVGVIGSMTHCYPWSIAILIKDVWNFQIGIDLESIPRVEVVDIRQVICRDVEIDWLRTRSAPAGPAIIFSAKEAVYKALYPLFQRYIDFKEIELSWIPERSCFNVRIVDSCLANSAALVDCQVYSWCQNDFVFSCSVCQCS